MCDEEELPVGKPTDDAEPSNDAENDATSGNFVDVAEGKLASMKRDELKEELRLRGQSLPDNKEALVTRLRKALGRKIGIGCTNKRNSDKVKSNTKEAEKTAGKSRSAG